VHQTMCHLVPLRPDRSLRLARRRNGENGHDSLNAERWIGEKACLVTTDTGATMTISRPDITAELPERETTSRTSCRWHQGTPPHTEESFSEVYPGVEPTNSLCVRRHFIMGLDTFHTHDASVDLWPHKLWPLPSPYTKCNRKTVTTRCDQVTAMRLE
jgi:hypothetical protein